MIPCSELIHLSKDTVQLPLGIASIRPPFSEIEMQELPRCWSVRSVAVTDKVSPWNCIDKAPGLPMGLLTAPVDNSMPGGDRQVSELFLFCIMSLGT